MNVRFLRRFFSLLFNCLGSSYFVSVFLARGKSGRIERIHFTESSGISCWETEIEVLLPITQLWERRHSYKNFVSLRKITWFNSQKKPVKQHVEDPYAHLNSLVCHSSDLIRLVLWTLNVEMRLQKQVKCPNLFLIFFF